MPKKKFTVQGLTIHIDKINQNDYISLTDIAKQSEDTEPRFLIMSWMKNSSTIEFLETWELLHNPGFNRDQMVTFKAKYIQNRNILTPSRWINETNAIGITSKAGRYGGTYAHSDIALNFCYWLSPSFQVYLIKEFQRLKEEEANRLSFDWHIRKITDNIDEVRNLLDTIPGQDPARNRLNFINDEEE